MPMESIIVERNNVPLEFKGTIGKRGKIKGVEYPAPEVSKDTLQQIQDWLGTEKLIALYKGELQKKCQNWFDESLNDDTGVFSPEVFIDMAKSVSARGEKMSDLEEEMEDITSQITDLASNMEDPTNVGKMQELALELKSLRAAHAAKKRPRKEKAAQEAVAA